MPKRCPNGSRRNAASGRCVSTNAKKRAQTAASTSKTKPAKSTVSNARTRPAKSTVSNAGTAKPRAWSTGGVQTPDLSQKACPPGKIMNDATGRCVSRTGAIGRKILSGQSSGTKIDHDVVEHVVAEAVKEAADQTVRENKLNDPDLVKQAATKIRQAIASLSSATRSSAVRWLQRHVTIPAVRDTFVNYHAIVYGFIATGAFVYGGLPLVKRVLRHAGDAWASTSSEVARSTGKVVGSTAALPHIAYNNAWKEFVAKNPSLGRTLDFIGQTTGWIANELGERGYVNFKTLDRWILGNEYIGSQ